MTKKSLEKTHSFIVGAFLGIVTGKGENGQVSGQLGRQENKGT